ncbi:MAG: cation diffusion facilitator family transporter [Verrucomicrobia bacterium]|nr:cation diffusion facilitator family transporter [Verrucomicrobiota bacterium]MCF7707446.1 cation diffusion facilitator family transporter [Verrucomicrobiota bacterium]
MKKIRYQRGIKTTLIGLGVNAFLATAKMTAGILGNSYALIADSVESLGDVFSSLIVWRGITVASIPADKRHPYGHGKAEPIAAAIVSIMLLIASIGITVQAVREILNPHTGPEPYTLLVLILIIIIKETLYRFVWNVGETIESSVVKTDAWHHRSDAITSLAAAIGISIAVFGGPGYESADAIAAIVAAGFIARNGYALLKPALNELMDAMPDTDITKRITAAAENTPEVIAIEKCIVRKMGYDVFVDMHIEVDPNMSVNEAHDVAHKVKDNIKTHISAVSDVLIHIEPHRG